MLMLRSVLEAVVRSGLGPSCYLVSPDEEALAVARKAGGTPVMERKNRGVNAAVYLGIKQASASQYMVLPADLPLLRAANIREVVRLKSRGVDVVISPSRHLNGTNVLLFSKSKMIPLRYDRNSFWSHLGEAARMGYVTAVYSGEGSVFDVDTRDDLHDLARFRRKTAAVMLARGAI